MKYRKVLPLTSMAIAILGLSACGGGSSSNTEDNSGTTPPPPTPTYVIDTNIEGGGTANPDTAEVEEGESHSIELVPDDGFKLESAEGCGGTLEEQLYSIASVEQSCTVNITFNELPLPLYLVDTTIEGSGSVHPQVAEVEKGKSHSIEIVPDDGFKVESAEGCDGSLEDTLFQIDSVEGRCTVAIVFSEVPTVVYQINTRIDGSGTIDPETAEVEEGSSFSFDLHPKNGYEVYSAQGCNGELEGHLFQIETVTQDCTVEAEFRLAPLAIEISEPIHKFSDDTMIPPHEYGGEYHEGGLVSYSGTASAQELWLSGGIDVIFSLARGYAAGIDTRVQPYLFRNENGTLVYDEEVSFQPTTSARRWARFGDLPADNGKGIFYVGHDGGDGTFADAKLIRSGGIPEDISEKLPATPLSNLTGQSNSVHAHAMAGGDLTGSGRTDFVVIDWGACDTDADPWICYDSPYYLLQKEGELAWELVESDFLRKITLEQPLVEPDAGEGWNLLLDAHLIDANGNGLDDLIVGYGHGSAYSAVYFNQGPDANGVPQFSPENSATLPESPYGLNNGLHLYTWSDDLNDNGHQDLLILWSRFEPYYGGWTFQLLENDGHGNFTDVSGSAFNYLSTEHIKGGYLEWTDNFTLTDLNGNGHPDIIGSDGGHPDIPPLLRIWLNDGSGKFTEIPVDTSNTHRNFTPTAGWHDFAGTGVFGTVIMDQTATDDTFTELEVSFYQLMLNRAIRSLDEEQAVTK